MLNFRAHTLQIKRISGGGYDLKGNPVPVIEAWSDPIPCHYATNERQDLLRYNDGVFRVFDYQVWIDPIEEDLTSKYVRLIDQYGNIEVEEKQVQKCVNRQLTTKFYL